MTKAINETTMLQLMEDILLVLHRHGADEMVNFYVNGKHFSTDENTDFIEQLFLIRRRYRNGKREQEQYQKGDTWH